MPVIVNFLTIPYVVRSLGADSYGILMLSTAVMGYFALLDINLAVGSIRYISEYHAKNEFENVNEVLTVSFFGYIAAGITGTVLIYISTDLFLLKWFNIPENLKNLSATTLHLTAVGFFLNMMQNYLSSISRAIHRFDILAKMEAGFGISLMLLTVLILYLGFGLIEVVVLRLIIAFVNCLTCLWIVKKIIPYASFVSRVSKGITNKIASFSAYSFMSKIATAITNNSDKLIIGSFLSSAAVTLYAIPYLLVSRLMNISVRFSMVIFPIASELGAIGRRDELEKIYIVVSRHIFFLNIMITTILCLFSMQILRLWMGDIFAQKTYVVLILLSLGMFLDSLTNLPSLINDGLSFPHITGSFALSRAVFGVIALLIGAKFGGLTGVAFSYMLSSLIFSIAFLLFVHKKTLRMSLMQVINQAFLVPVFISIVAVLATLMARVFLPQSIVTSISEFILATGIFVFFGYRSVLSSEWQTKISSRFGIGKP